MKFKAIVRNFDFFVTVIKTIIGVVDSVIDLIKSEKSKKKEQSS